MYINTSTCGDARIFNPNDKNDMADTNQGRVNRGILRTKIENGEGTVPIREERSELTWDGILGGGRILTMSCSDKVMRWNVLGLQGSLLSQIIKPIYLSSIILGMLYHNDHFQRAMFGRLNKCDLSLLDSSNTFRLARPMLSPTSSQTDRRAKNAPDFSVNWNCDDGHLEMVKTDTGRLADGSSSRLAKIRMFSKYVNLAKTLTEKQNEIKILVPIPLNTTERETYLDVKRKSYEYEKVKLELYKAMKLSSVGIWVKKPEEIEDFYPTNTEKALE